MAAAVKGTDAQKVPSIEELEKELLGPKGPQEEKQKKVKEKKEGKDAGKFGVAFLASLFWVTLFGAFILLVLFDPTEGNAIRGKVLLLLNPDAETREEYYAADLYDIQEAWKDIHQEEDRLLHEWDDLYLFEEELDDLESELENKQTELDDKLERLDEILAKNGGSMTITADLTKTAKDLENTTPAAAARALEMMEMENVVRLCSIIGSKKMGLILSQMEPEFFADLLTELTALDDDEWDDWDDDEDW
ncbi:MAG: hypothetical protein FWG31_03945 [Oscillospiraceae bacterium]|nr:hypothetical protein [Oscillospiraceae bacterium]